jgi:Spy/CpxP family protein refolding chaperone
MKNNMTRKTLVVLTIVAVVGFGAVAFAGWGMGYGHHGWHHEGWGEPEHGYMMRDLDENDIVKMEKERESFFKATENLRQDLDVKELELRSELAKENPDADKAAKLQKEVSELEAKIDQKRIDHMIVMKKINPNAGRNFMGRGGMGYGPSYGGYCWR